MDTKKLINIFIVEDNNLFTQALKADIETVFKNRPIRIYSFETGEKCMEKFKQVMPELVILDYHLNSKSPDAADGIKILDWIKKENKETNVIILTADDHLDIALKSFEHGASDYVVKTETKFKKINYSLMNMFKMMEAKDSAKSAKRMLVALSLSIVFVIGGITVIEIFAPSLLQ